MSREGSRLPDVVIQASARKAAEEAIPEGANGEGWGFRAKSRSDPGPAKSRGDFVGWFWRQRPPNASRTLLNRPDRLPFTATSS